MNVNIKQLGMVQEASPCSIIDMILKLKPEELNNYCAAKINGNVVDLRDVIEEDCEIDTGPGTLENTMNPAFFSTLRVRIFR